MEGSSQGSGSCLVLNPVCHKTPAWGKRYCVKQAELKSIAWKKEEQNNGWSRSDAAETRKLVV
jgi:hypothetical protein